MNASRVLFADNDNVEVWDQVESGGLHYATRNLTKGGQAQVRIEKLGRNKIKAAKTKISVVQANTTGQCLFPPGREEVRKGERLQNSRHGTFHQEGKPIPKRQPNPPHGFCKTSWP